MRKCFSGFIKRNACAEKSIFRFLTLANGKLKNKHIIKKPIQQSEVQKPPLAVIFLQFICKKFKNSNEDLKFLPINSLPIFINFERCEADKVIQNKNFQLSAK